MIETNNNLAGSAVFWTLGEATRYADFSQALQNAGFTKFIPERMTELAALKAALEDEFPGHEVFRVKDGGTAFEVVKIVRDMQSVEKKNEYKHVLTAFVDQYLCVNIDKIDSTLEHKLSEAFRENRNSIPYHQMSRALVEIVYSLNGTTLRPSGGIYWIPNDRFERWEQVANAIELSGEKNKVFALRTILDEHSAAVLREALSAEIERESKSIADTIADPVSGMKAANNAKRRANDLRRKIGMYETEFQIGLNDLRRLLDEATGTEARASLLDMASAGGLLSFAS